MNGFIKILGATVVASLFTYLCNIILANQLSLAQLGELALFVSYSTLIQSFLGIGTPSMVATFVSDVNRTSKKIKVLSDILQIIILTATLFLLIGIILYLIIDMRQIILYSLVHAMFFVLHSVYRTYLNNEGDNDKYSFNLVSTNLISLLFTVTILFYFTDWTSRFFGLIVADIFGIVILSYKIGVKISLYSVSNINRNYISTASPMVLHLFLGALYGFFDRIIIAKVLGDESAGIYWLLIQLTIPLMLVFEATSRFLIGKINQSLRQKLNNFAHNAIKLILMVTLVLSLIIIFTPFYKVINYLIIDYDLRSDWIKIALIYQLNNGIYLILSLYLLSGSYTSKILQISSIILFIQILSLYIIVPVYGITGALTVVASVSILRSSMYLLFIKSSKFSWEHKQL